jgi:hypothetical protein
MARGAKEDLNAGKRTLFFRVLRVLSGDPRGDKRTRHPCRNGPSLSEYHHISSSQSTRSPDRLPLAYSPQIQTLPTHIPPPTHPITTMCSNKNNNRRHYTTHCVVEQGRCIIDDRTRITDPALRVAGMPLPAGQTVVAVPVAVAAGAVLSADAAAIALAPIPVLNRPRVYPPIPAFDARPTIAAARRAAFGQIGRANTEAIAANRVLRKQHIKQVRKLRSYKIAKENVARLPQLPLVARSDVEGLTAAKLLTAQQAPALIHSHESLENKCRQYGNNPLAHQLVRANIWQHSTMVAVVDLRDDEERSYDGNTLRRGAIYEPETALSCAKVNLQIYCEVTGNKERALREFRRVARFCPSIQALNVEVIGENNLPAAQEVARVLQAEFEAGSSGFAGDVAIDFAATLYESE